MAENGREAVRIVATCSLPPHRFKLDKVRKHACLLLGTWGPREAKTGDVLVPECYWSPAALSWHTLVPSPRGWADGRLTGRASQSQSSERSLELSVLPRPKASRASDVKRRTARAERIPPSQA